MQSLKPLSMKHYLKNKTVIASAIIVLGAIGYSFTLLQPHVPLVQSALAAQFAELGSKGNSSCSSSFMGSIDGMADTAQIKGSCCSPMNLARYTEQVEGLKKYANIPEIPSDPYDIQAGLAKQLKGYYDTQLTPDQQKAYDYAMTNSMEKGPCCCKCWRWYVYGGLGKLLIQKYHFTGEQVTEIWNLSDGCGGAGDHVGH